MTRPARPLALAALAALLAPARAEGSFSIAALFGNGMTLQAGASPSARVWGWSLPGASIAVYQRSFNTSGGAWGRPSLACAPAARAGDGLWVAELPPTPAGGPYRLEFYATAAGASLANATLDWLWFGDVFLYSGQSNMGIPTHAVLGPHNESAWEMAQYLNRGYYGARALQLPQGVVAASPQAQISTHSFQLGWTAFSNVSLTDFSAVAAFTTAGFLDVAGQFNNHSAGAIQAEWGGTSINIWMPAAAVAQCPTPFAQTTPTVDEGPSTPTTLDSVAYNALIAPLTVGPLAIKGVVWCERRAARAACGARRIARSARVNLPPVHPPPPPPSAAKRSRRK